MKPFPSSYNNPCFLFVSTVCYHHRCQIFLSATSTLIGVIRAWIARYWHQRAGHHAAWRRVSSQIRDRRCDLYPETASTFRCVFVGDKCETQIRRVENSRQRITSIVWLRPGSCGRDIEFSLIRIWIATSRMRDEVRLICLRVGAEGWDEGNGCQIGELGEIEVEIVESWQDIGSMLGRRHRIL